MPGQLTPLTGYTELRPDESLAASQDFFRRMASRRTVRDFSPDAIPRAVIETAIRTAATAPSGANHQPWHFVAISDPDTKRHIREAAEMEERAFYKEKASDEWLEALAPLGTDDSKPFLQIAPWLIVVFSQKRGGPRPGDDLKNYYVTESVGIATGLLIANLHLAGLATLTHTPAPMTFLTEICKRPSSEKPFVLLVVGKPAQDASVPVHSLVKKGLADISTFND